MNTVKKVVSFLLRTILRPITDALVIKAIEKGEVSEREIVEKAKRKLIRSLDEELPKCVDYDEEAAKGAAILKKQAMAAKTIDDMLKIQSESKELKYFNRVFKKATRKGDCSMNIKRYIDAKVCKEVRHCKSKRLKKKVNDLDIRGYFFKKTPKDVLIWDFFYTALNPIVTDRLIEDIKAQKVNEKQVLRMIKKPLIHIIDKEMPEVSEYKGKEMVALFKMIKRRIAAANRIDDIASISPRCSELQRLSEAFKQLHKDSLPVKYRKRKRDSLISSFKDVLKKAKKCWELGTYVHVRTMPRFARVGEILNKIMGVFTLGVAGVNTLKILLGDLKRESNQLVKEGAPGSSKLHSLCQQLVLVGLGVVNLMLSKSLKNAREQVERDIKKEKSQTADFLKDAGVKGMKKGQHVKARDPEYVESLKGGNSSKQSGSNKQQPSDTRKKVGKALLYGGAGLAALGGGILGARKLLRSGKLRGMLGKKSIRKPAEGMTFEVKKQNLKPTQAKSLQPSKNPLEHELKKNRRAKIHGALKNKNEFDPRGKTTKQFQEALNNPNTVWDI